MDDLPTLINKLVDPSAGERAAAAERLARLGDQAQAAAVPLVRAAGDASEAVRQWATSALEDLGPPSPRDGAALAALLADVNQDVAYWAATLLGRLASDQFVDPLARVLDPARPMLVRQRACWALEKIGPAARSAIGPRTSRRQRRPASRAAGPSGAGACEP